MFGPPTANPLISRDKRNQTPPGKIDGPGKGKASDSLAAHGTQLNSKAPAYKLMHLPARDFKQRLNANHN